MSTITALVGSDGITTANSMTKINTNFSNLNTDKIETSVIDTDTTLAANSDSKIATQKAVKTYVDAGGNVNASTTAKGISQEATLAQTRAGTPAGSTGARLFVNPSSLWIVGEVKWGGWSTAPEGTLDCDGSAVSRTTYASLFTAISTAFGAGDGSSTFNVPDMRGRVAVAVGANTWTTTFAASDVNVGTNVITVPSNTTLYDGVKIRLTTTNTLPTGLSLSTDYYVIRASATTIKLASSRNNAIANTPTAIDITGQGTGTNTITVQDLTTRTLGERGGEETRSLSTAELPSHFHNNLFAGGEQLSLSGGVSSDWNYITLNGNADSDDNLFKSGSDGGSIPHNIMNPYMGLRAVIKY